ncbi:MAG: hypothetical protein JWL81_977 [Verrucomicrobiales bacterium]|nr:hypothetical protein [Verrucomicrobiales bacterium]
MKFSALCGVGLCLLAVTPASATPVPIANSGFETQTPELTSGQYTTTLTSWLETGGPGAAAGFFEYIPGFSAAGTDHLGMEAGHEVWQDLGVNYSANSIYTLTVSTGNRAGQSSAGNASTYLLTTSSGSIYGRNSTDAFSTVPVGTFADAPTVVLDTINEPAAVGKPIRVLLRAGGNGRSHFDEIRLDTVASTQSGRPLGNSTAATAITGTSATVGGSVTSIGTAAPSVRIYYGTADAGTDPADWQLSLALPGTFSAAFSTPLTGLSAATTYYYRARFTNASGSTWASSSPRFFTTPGLPALVNLPATNFSPTSATVGARVVSFPGIAPGITIYYGTADGGTTVGSWSNSVALGQTSATITGTLPNLAPSTTYYYRAAATNAAGKGWAAETRTFSTPGISPPSIVTRAADNISLTGARLNAEVMTIGNAVPAVTFYYGPVDGGNIAASWANTISAANGTGKVAVTPGSLAANTTYFFRAAATNSAGTSWSPETMSFTTSQILPPVVRTLPASHVRSTLATLSGRVTSTGNNVPSVTLYWGQIDGGTTAAAWANTVPMGTSPDTFERVLKTLTPGTVYYVRAFASNSAGGSWAPTSETFTTTLTETAPTVVINEIHYDPLDPTKPQEFIELHNAGATPVNLTGWRIASAVDYTFGPVTLPAGGYFCVVQNPTQFATTWPAAAANSAGPWIGKLKNSGETIELRNAAGDLVNAVDFGEGFPWPTASRGLGPSMELLHPSLDPGLGASWRRATATATPGAANGAKLATASAAPPAIRAVSHFPEQPTSSTTVPITATVTDPDGIGSVVMRYQVVVPGTYWRKSDAAFTNPVNWTNLTMLDDGTAGDAVAGDSIYTALIPATVQAHRRLVRYQITVTDSLANTVRVPYPDDEQPNFAYFVYDALPAWSGAMRPTAFNGFPATPVQNFPVSLLQSIEPWHLLANETDVIACQYSSEAIYQGALVHRGKVYDHITYQVRGIGSTYVSGKNKWGLKFNRAHDFQAYDNWNRPYAEKWNSLGLNACAGPWAAVNRGAAGIDEALSFRAYELAGIPSLRTSYVHWRVIRRTAEVNDAAATITGDPMGASIKGQYSGDLWGLYLAMEPTEGNFLDERGLGDGNIYSIEGNNGDKKHQSNTQPAGTTDWDAFRNGNITTGQPITWYQNNMDLEALYTFLAMNRLVGNTDVRPGDNYRYYHRPEDNKWVVMPYDLDMMYIAAHHWGGTMDNSQIVAGQPNTIRAISRHAALALDYRNRCRELLSLLAGDATANGGQIGQLVQEYARIVNPPDTALTWADLDAAMWNLHPRSAGSGANTGQSSHRGNFFRTRYLDGSRGAGGPTSTGTWIRDLAPSGDFSDHEHLAQWFTDFTTNTYPSTAANWVRKATNAGGSGTDNDVNRQKGYGWKYLEWESLYGGFVDAINTPAASLADTAYPYTPVIFTSGNANFPANDLRFISTEFNDPQGAATAAAVQWRIGEISSPGIPGYDASKPSIYEITPVWTSAEIPLTAPTVAEVRVPASSVVPGHTYRARVRHKDSTGRWSFWSPPVQFIAAGLDTATYQNALRITEINYDPAPISPAESSSPGWNPAWTAQQFEFIELTNISNAPVDLTDFRFTKGVDYNFLPNTTLAAGAKIIIAKNPVAFAIRYGSGLPLAAGSFDPDSLSNGGEQLKLSYGAGIAIFDFLYDNDPLWPTSPNGTGPTLVLINPEKPNLNHGDPMEWRASIAAKGTPGTDDRTSYAQWAALYPGLGAPGDDPDNDGITNLMEFSLGSLPLIPSPDALPTASVVADRFHLTFTYPPAIAGQTRHVEFSSDLAGWVENGRLVNRVTLPDGRFTDTWESYLPFTPTNIRQFARLRVTTP